MSHNASLLECLYCSRPTPRQSAKQHACPSCFRAHVEQFGPDWYMAEWHRALLPDYGRFCHESEKMGQAVSIEDVPNVTVADVVESAELKPVRYQHIFQEIRSLHIAQSLGARRIKRALDAADVQPSVDLSTVKRYLKVVKAEVAETACNA